MSLPGQGPGCLRATCPAVSAREGVDAEGGDPSVFAWRPQKTKLTFLRCAVLLKWEFRKELFGKLAWGRGLSAENDVFIYTVRCRHPPG